MLILDNAPCHPPDDELVKETCDGKIWVHFMPPNVTSLIQPMDQNAIRLVKLHYKNSLLTKIISSENNDVISILKQLNLYEAATMITMSLKNITKTSLSNCWNKILYRNDNDIDDEDNIPLGRLLQQDEVLSVTSNGVHLLNSIFPDVSFMPLLFCIYDI